MISRFRKEIIALILIVIATSIIFQPWTYKYSDGLITWDKVGYYLYLPNLFIYNDWKYFSFAIDYFKLYQPSSSWYQTLELQDYRHIITYPLGLSFFQLPFFLAGHLSALILNYPQDGFSTPYVFWIYLSGIFYVICGLIIISRILQRFFPFNQAFIITVILLLSTNLFFYGLVDSIMPHSYSFFLLAVLVLYTIKWHEHQSFKNTLIICFSIGFLITIRTTDIISILIPVLYGITSLQSFSEKILLLKKHLLKIIVCFLIGLSPFYLQMFYWHYSSGSWIFNAYGFTNLGFSWDKPHIVDFLFSFRKGWFIYTPAMILTIIGFFYMYKSNMKNLFYGILFFLIADIYIFSSWNTWWFGGSYGQRSMVQSYALLVIPFAAGIISIYKIKAGRIILIPFIITCITINFILSWVYHKSLMLTDGMTKSMYKEALFQPANALIPESYQINRMQWKDEAIKSQKIILEDTMLRIIKNGDFSPVINSTGKKMKENGQWFRCTYETRFIPSFNSIPNSLHIVNEIKNNNKTKFWRGKSFADQFSMKDQLSGWKSYTVDFKLPYYISSDDEYLIYFWLNYEQIVHIKNIRLYSLEINKN
jgi:hypothetical protein